MATESMVTDLLGDDLEGERVLYAVVASTRRWYSYLPWGAGGPGLHSWYLGLTANRVFILSAQRRGRNWRGLRHVRAERGDVEVERFRRTGISSWMLILNVRTEGRWGLHGVGWIPGLSSNSRNARQIAESLGWQPHRHH